jgi:hypothetical protein
VAELAARHWSITVKKYLIGYSILFVALVGLFVYFETPLYIAVILSAAGMAITWFKTAVWPF